MSFDKKLLPLYVQIFKSIIVVVRNTAFLLALAIGLTFQLGK